MPPIQMVKWHTKVNIYELTYTNKPMFNHCLCACVLAICMGYIKHIYVAYTTQIPMHSMFKSISFSLCVSCWRRICFSP